MTKAAIWRRAGKTLMLVTGHLPANTDPQSIPPPPHIRINATFTNFPISHYHFTHWAFLLKSIYVLKSSRKTEKCFRLSQPSTLDRLKMKLQCRLIRELSIRVDLLIEHSRGGEVGGSSQTGETDYLQNPHRNCPSPASTPVQWHRQLCADL